METYEFNCQLDVHEVCFLLLDRHYLFKRILNIKVTKVLSELVSVDLREGQQIIHGVIEQFR